MREAFHPHREYWTEFEPFYRHVFTFSQDYPGGLNPWGEVPWEAERISDDIFDFLSNINERLNHLAGRFIGFAKSAECDSASIFRKHLDFERRPNEVKLEVGMRSRPIPGFVSAVVNETYYLYDNGVGIYKKIDHREVLTKGRGRVSQEMVLAQRFLTILDLPTLNAIRDSVITV